MQGKLISLTLEIGGQIVTIGPDGLVNDLPFAPPDSVEYAPDGWSVETKNGCVRNKLVDAQLNRMANGDEYQRQAAADAPVWFGTIIPGREYNEADRKLLIRNYKQDSESVTFISGWGGGMMFEQFYASIERNEADKRPPFSYIYDDEQDDSTTPIFGFNLYDAHSGVAEEYIKRLIQGAEALRRKAENPNAPNFDDWHKDK